MITSTTDELYEFNSYFDNQLTDTESFSARLFGKKHADCLLTDIDHYGCSILIPNKHPLLTETFNLTIMSPDNNRDIYTTLLAKRCRSDNYYSPTHIKVDLTFIDTTEDSLAEIDLLAAYFSSFKNHGTPIIKCRTTNK